MRARRPMAPHPHGGEHAGLMKEAYTMALYVAMTLMAALMLLVPETGLHGAGRSR